MERTARALAGYGRHGDNNLLHVSDQELRGIELLSGKKFTRNPDTGLPEAFNWSSLIPVAAGIAGTAVAGPMGGALAAGATSAAKAKIEGKSTEQALTQGLISGVTSYAGADIMSGVGDPVAQAASGAAQGAAQGATQTAAQGATEAAAQGATEAAAQGAAGAATQGAAAAPGAVAGGPMYPDFTPGEFAAVGGTPTAGPAAGVGGQLQPANGGQLDFRAIGADGKPITPFMDKVSNVYNNPGAAFSKIGENISNNKMSALIAAGGTYATALDAIGPPKMPGEEPYDPSKYPEQFPANPRTWNAPGAGYQPGYSSEYRYFAKGGLADLRKEDGVTANAMNEAKAALLGEHPRPSEALGRFRNMFGEDALDVLRDKVTGGRVRGAGGGMDDLVPGTIEGRQQVRLADGEFVLPAHIVSAIGDGSTDHGVRRLKEMMDSIYRQKYKSDSLPKRLKKGTLVDE